MIELNEYLRETPQTLDDDHARIDLTLARWCEIIEGGQEFWLKTDKLEETDWGYIRRQAQLNGGWPESTFQEYYYYVMEPAKYA